MLEKIVSIKSVGRFRRYSASGDVSFRKLTLIYAENGRGKTTLCAILRSLQSGRVDLISERKTLASTDSPNVNIRIDGTNYQFNNNAWTMTYPNIVIFDPSFINENVYSGEYVEHDQRKNLYKVIIGSQGVQLAIQIEDIDQQIRDKNTILRDKKENLSRYLPPTVSLEDYLDWQPAADIESQIQKKTQELSSRQRAVAMSNEIRAKSLLTNIHLPSLPPNFDLILSKQLTDITADAEYKVRQQILHHQMEQQGEPWLSQGLGYVKNDKCPFCEQNVRSNDLVTAYISYFNTAYKELKEEVAKLSQLINSAIGETSLSLVQQVISGNLALVEFWKQFISFDLPVISYPNIQQIYATLRESCLNLVRKKQDNPTERVTPDAEFTTALSNIMALRKLIDSYNASVDTANNLINGQKATALREDDVTTLKSDIVLLDAQKKRFEPIFVQACLLYKNELNTKTALEQKKETTRQLLDQHCRTLLSTYEQSINEYLDQFNAGFRITNSRHLYPGGTPRSQYQIKINNTAVDLGDTRTPSGIPCFKTTLSSGDRSALALAFFLAMLQHDTNIAQKIVVFDDPFTSLDCFRRTCTQQLIQRRSESALQVIVLSHDPFFLKLIADEYSNARTTVKSLQMSKAGDSTVIGEWDVGAETQSSYMKDFSTLQKFYRERSGDLRSVVRAIRPFLEGWLRNNFPGHFLQNEWLGNFIDKIRGADTTSGLHQAMANLTELDAINSYSKRYHHQQNTNADSERVTPDELHSYVKRTLRLVGGD